MIRGIFDLIKEGFKLIGKLLSSTFRYVKKVVNYIKNKIKLYNKEVKFLDTFEKHNKERIHQQSKEIL